ncbi:MAG: NAD(P)/FAD-dependent oxidoreductase [Thermodesulfobacteriota bacterium]|jgi:protoporphyrinogen oxidase|nr:MAG: NAD(P)/FAD-dependent oxidoreductase [Thermodesulfobacteriota bacterium]
MHRKTAVIIGAGPAGLTAAYELLHRTEIKPIIFESTSDIGGISKTVNYKGNRIDIGGHRFFSKSDRIMRWWQHIMPVQDDPARDEFKRSYENQERGITFALNHSGPDPEKNDRVMLIRHRLSRIFFLRKFFDYPVSLNLNTLSNLGVTRIFKIGCSYAKIKILPKRKELSLEDFFINRFGKELYLTFFKDYTEKVWGIPCTAIKPEWGAQRIKGLSLTKTFIHAFKKIFKKKSSIGQKNTETTLIERFLYPKYGPGQMWETVAQIIKEKGGEIYTNQMVKGLMVDREKVVSVEVDDLREKRTYQVTGDFFFSTMAVKDLVAAIKGYVPDHVRNVAAGLVYRDFITVGLLLKKLLVKNESKMTTLGTLIPDNWIYIQEKDVKVGRLQIFNNWSPYLVANKDTVWIGMEYFCNEGDELWNKSDEEFSVFAVDELARIDIIDKEDVMDSVVIRMGKTYPAYFGTYDRFNEIREFIDTYENLFLIGRNGMHRYNNMDHSMLTAMVAVDNILNKIFTKDNIWSVNTEQDYHEER